LYIPGGIQKSRCDPAAQFTGSLFGKGQNHDLVHGRALIQEEAHVPLDKNGGLP
jgi:hypothetical protein